MSSKCGSLMRELSLGKYNTKLYFGAKQETYSTITGGLITIIFAITVVLTSLNILYETLNWNNYIMTTTYTDLSDISNTLKLEHFKSSLLNLSA